MKYPWEVDWMWVAEAVAMPIIAWLGSIVLILLAVDLLVFFIRDCERRQRYARYLHTRRGGNIS